MKKLLTCLLSMLLLFTAAMPALAADITAEAPVPATNTVSVTNVMVDSVAPAGGSALSADMARVTKIVKTTLGIDDSYTDFSGSQMESGAATMWYLNWSKQDGNISVEADNEGRIYSYNHYNYNDYRSYYNNNYAPVFPKNERAQARQAAESFVKRVLAKNEAIVFGDDNETFLEPRTQDSFYFYGNISLGGIPSPLYASITVNAEDMSVSYFWRQNMAAEYVGGIPSPTPKVSATAAAATLATTQKLTLAYYLGDNGNEARLQYRPVYDGTYYVDAQTGALIDMKKLYEAAEKSVMDRGLSGGGMDAYSMDTMNEAAAPQMASLSEAEKSGVEKLEGLLSREELDKAARAISELGLSDFILSSVNYQQDYSYTGDAYSSRPAATSGTYSAHLSYYREAKPLELGLSEQTYKKLKDEGRSFYIYKNLQLDAADAGLRNVNTNRPWLDSALITVKEQDFAAKGTAFLQKYFGEYYAQTALDEAYGAYDVKNNPFYYYMRQVNGYSFMNNYLNIGVNPYTGEIENFYMNWDKDITFAPAEGIITEAKARELYLASLECKLSYQGLPQAIDPAQGGVQPLKSYYGGGYVYKLALIYAYESKTPYDGVYAIDALSGESLSHGNYSREKLTYDDIGGSSAKAQIEELARYGIGYQGGKFKPSAQLTELDMLIFLLSADGYGYPQIEGDQDKTDEIYNSAFYRGLIGRGEKQPQRQISRGEFIKLIISASGYGKTAALPGIYKCNFADAGEIPADIYGYAAIAQGLGLVESGPAVKFRAKDTITRAEAAVVLYNFMARKY